MFSLRKPSDQQLAAWLARQAAAKVFTTEAAIPRPAPRGFKLNLGGAELGSGSDVYEAACDALVHWEMFPGSWVEIRSGGAPAAVGQTVGVLAYSLGAWSLNACRVVDLNETKSEARQCFGLTYATVLGHVYRGAERFEVVWDLATDRVRYELASYSQPRHPLMKILRPHVRGLQRRFALESPGALRYAMQARLTKPSAAV